MPLREGSHPNHNMQMGTDREERTLLLTVQELETLNGLVDAKIEGVLVHSQEYFLLRDIAHKLSVARQPRR